MSLRSLGPQARSSRPRSPGASASSVFNPAARPVSPAPTPSGVPAEVLSEASRFGARSGPVLTSRWSSGARTTLGHSASSPPTSPSAPGGDSARDALRRLRHRGQARHTGRGEADHRRAVPSHRRRALAAAVEEAGGEGPPESPRGTKLSARGASERGDLPHAASSGDRRDRVKMPA